MKTLSISLLLGLAQTLSDGTNLMERLPKIRTLGAVFDGSGSALAAGTITRCTQFNFTGTIQSASVTADLAGSASLDVRYASAANYNTTGQAAATSITGSTPITLTSARLYPAPGATTGSEIATWNKAVSPGVMCFDLSSASTVTTLTVVIGVLTN